MRDYTHSLLQANKPAHRPVGRWLLLIAIILVIIFVAFNDDGTRIGQPDTAPGSKPISNKIDLPKQSQPSQDSPTPTPVVPIKPATPVPATPKKEAAKKEAKAKQQEPPLPSLTETKTDWIEHRIKSGESLANIFKKYGLSANLLHRITKSSKTASRLAKIKPGQQLRLQLDDNGGLIELLLVRSKVNSLQILPELNSFSAQELEREIERRTATAQGTISTSLFIDGQKAGLSDGLILELASLFGWDIDFALELRTGDRFSLIYETQFLDGEKYDNGPILAAEFINKRDIYRAVRYRDSKGNVSYYDPEGHNKRRAFIRTPVKFGRISSRFTKRRWHPVLKKWRSHKGVDYAASTGTPVKATGSGKVTVRGWKGGYGRAVFIQHAGKYTTVYGHLSKFAGSVRKGTRVKQGQIIGYVGQSGLATGPHLHYEFRVHGVHRNPLTIKLPKSAPLPKKELKGFRSKTRTLLSQLDLLSQSNLASIQKDG